MKLSYLYYTILEKPFFIDLRRVDSRAVLIDRLLSHDADIDGRRLSQREPLAHCVATPIPGGTLVGPAASASDPTATATATATTAVGVVPMIIAGSSFWMPVGVTIFAGGIGSLIMVVTMLPVVYWKVSTK